MVTRSSQGENHAKRIRIAACFADDTLPFSTSGNRPSHVPGRRRFRSTNSCLCSLSVKRSPSPSSRISRLQYLRIVDLALAARLQPVSSLSKILIIYFNHNKCYVIIQLFIQKQNIVSFLRIRVHICKFIYFNRIIMGSIPLS